MPNPLFAILAHVSNYLLPLFGPVIFYLANSQEFNKAHAREAVNLSLNLTAYWLVVAAGTFWSYAAAMTYSNSSGPRATLFAFVGMFCTVALYLLLAVSVGYPLYGVYKAACHEEVRFPLIFRFLR